MRNYGWLTIDKPSKRDWCFIAPACFYAVWCLSQPRYKIIWEMGSGSMSRTSNGGFRIAWETEARVDRWTGLEERRGIGTLDNDPDWHPVYWFGIHLP